MTACRDRPAARAGRRRAGTASATCARCADDVEALIEDGKTYLETELVYQKTRAAFVADRAKGAFIYGALAAVFGFWR